MLVTMKKGRPKMGRPAGPPEKVRRNRVVVMVTDSELVRLTRLADAAGRPVGTLAYEIFARGLRRRP